MPTARYLDQPYLLAGRRIDPITGTLSYREVQKHLRRKELEVLALLAEAGGEQVARSVFIEQVWQGNPIVGEQGLTDTISALRRSLLDTDRENPLILTIPRRGYQLRASIRSISRDGGVAFVAGSVIDGRPDWRLKQLLEQTDAHESWLAEDGRSRRIFRFCRNEQQLRKLRREVVLMRYLREALASQEHVSTILDWQLEEPPYFLELAAPACGNLRGVMLGKSVPELAERWRLMQEVTEALAAVHAAGVVHRALSPDSVLVDRRKGERIALLGEFGLAALDDRQRLAELGIDAEGLSLKTGLLGPATAYTAPECVAGAPASAASDVYALGVLIAQTVRGDFQRLESSGFEGFPDPIAGLLQRCVAVDPATRPTAAELAGSLQAWTQPKPAPRRAEPPMAVPTPPAPVDAPPVAAPAAVAVAPTLPEAAAPPLTPVPLVPQRIGRYRIVSELAQGGMGVVYLAEQSEPVQRRVALKLIRAGLDSEQVLARFEAERQALAMMSHPNISAIFDAGSTPGGYPYFVMEFVPGKDIVSHCDAAKLNLRARIRLFLQVCDGVLHAHQKGVIHRDLKPSNILVKQKSEQPALVKLIDFGVAKSLTGGLGGGLHTRVGSFIGTPVYSCPEQVIDPTRDIDTRADLYSLGVVLYEILVGVPPRSVKDLDADTPAELARRLRDTQTPPMGSRYTGLSPEERQRIAELRTLSTDGLSMQLCSDLDWIVGKCIAQDPEDRYATVQDLRQDLQRWLDDRPVEARPTSNWYRFRKLVRRNKLNTAMISLAVCLVLTSSALAILGYVRAERALGEAQAASDFQSKQIRSITPAEIGSGLGDSLARAISASPQHASADLDAQKIKDLLQSVNLTDVALDQVVQFIIEPAVKSIEADFSEFPALQNRLRYTQARNLQSLGAWSKALTLAQKTLEQSISIHGPDDALTIDAMILVGALQQDTGMTEESRATIANAVALTQARYGRHHLSSARASKAMCANDTKMLRNSVNSIDGCRESFVILVDLLGPTHPEAMQAKHLLAVSLFQAERLEESKELLKEVIEHTSKASASDRLGPLATMIEILLKEGKIHDAASWAEQAYRLSVQYHGTQHPQTLTAQNNLAALKAYVGDFDTAISLLRGSVELQTKLFGLDHHDTMMSIQNLARMLFQQGKLREAQAISLLTPDLKESDEIRNQITKEDGMIARADIHLEMGQGGEALALFRSVVENRTRRLGANHLQTLQTKFQLARALRFFGDIDGAHALLVEIVDVASRSESADEAILAVFKGRLASFQRLRGEYEASERSLRESLKVLGALPNRRHDALFIERELCEALIAAKNTEAALQTCSLAYEKASGILQSSDHRIVYYLLSLGRAKALAGRTREAEEHFLLAWSKLEKNPELAPQYFGSVSGELAKTYRALGTDPENSRKLQRWQTEHAKWQQQVKVSL